MMPLSFSKESARPLRVLCLGAHSDDIEIGCGGTLIELFEQQPDSRVLWIVFSGSEQRAAEALKSANLYLNQIDSKDIIIKSFRDGFFPYIGLEIKEFFEDFRHRMNPDIIFTHHRKDLHQDHRLLSELTWNTFRDHLIFEYEILKYDGDVSSPNVFSALKQSTCEQKIDRLNHCFRSQLNHEWFDEESFRGLLRIRGVESNSPTKLAEGFYCRKASLRLTSP